MSAGRPPAAALLAAIILAAAGCATLQRGLSAIDRGFEYASKGLSFASWEHFAFSVRMNTRQPPLATPGDAATAARQGGWWGDPVPVAENK